MVLTLLELKQIAAEKYGILVTDIVYTNEELDLNTKVINFLQEEKKLYAIKAVRDVKGWGLKDSKDYVDYIEAKLEKEAAQRTYYGSSSPYNRI